METLCVPVKLLDIIQKSAINVHTAGTHHILASKYDWLNLPFRYEIY